MCQKAGRKMNSCLKKNRPVMKDIRPGGARNLELVTPFRKV